MGRFLAPFAILALLVLPRAALAGTPDFQGERGFEFQLMGGYGLFASNGNDTFCPAVTVSTQAGCTSAGAPDYRPAALFNGGFAARAHIGYRFLAYLSAGLSFGFQDLTSNKDANTPGNELRYPNIDTFSSFSIGAYVRMYPLALFTHGWEYPRVRFREAFELRRLEPWLSVGFEFVPWIQWQRTYSDDNRNFSHRATSYVGVPIGLGADYRVLPQFSVGLAVFLSPMAGASTSHSGQMWNPGTDRAEPYPAQPETFTPQDTANLQFFVGLTARYTLTF